MRNHPARNSGSAGASPPWQSTPTGLRSEWQLAAALSSVTALRWWLRAFLGQADLSIEEIENLLLAACEAATNAVEQAQELRELSFDVCTEIDYGAVTIVIQDCGLWRQRTSPGDRGRGLVLMRALANIIVTVSPSGTTVTIRNHPVDADAPIADESRAS
jgi:anti-sigma regulatory factor (Ser/Thr protein kinase)